MPIESDFKVALKAIVQKYKKDPDRSFANESASKRAWRRDTFHPQVIRLARLTLKAYKSEWTDEDIDLVSRQRWSPWAYWSLHVPAAAQFYDYAANITPLRPTLIAMDPRATQRLLVQEATRSIMYRSAALWGLSEATAFKDQIVEAVLNTSAVADALWLDRFEVSNLVHQTADEVENDIRSITLGAP